MKNKETDDLEVEEDILVMAVTTTARSRQKILVYTTPEKALIKEMEPALSTLEEVLSARNTDAYCIRARPTVGVPA